MLPRNKLLATDLHLTNNPLESYRWDIFSHLTSIAIQNNVDTLFLLGDIFDRKDNHPSELLNRFVEIITDFYEETGVFTKILMGNHDQPVNGTPYWNFLNTYSHVRYITEPTVVTDMIFLLPFSANPLEEWQGLPLANAKAIMMHQTVAGALIEGNRKIDSAPHPMPILPRGVPVFSGDVHRPQKIGSITYVGASHPVRFGEDWRCRVLLVKGADWNNPVELAVPHIKRQILDIKKTLDLPNDFRSKDQVRIRFHINKSQLTNWPVEQEAIRKWAEALGVKLVSMEAILIDEIKKEDKEVVTQKEISTPDNVIRDYCADQKLDELTLNTGLALLNSI